MEPVEDQVVGLGWLVLRSHVASTVDRSEGEPVLTDFDVTDDLVLESVRSVCFGDSPVGGVNPASGSEGWDTAVNISGVL